MKGIILAGGSGTRLYPITHALSQAAAAGLRQADDLLSAVDADAGRHPRDPDHHHAGRPGAVPRRCSATAASGACASTMPPSRSPRAWRRPSSSARTSSTATTATLVLGDNIFFGHDLTDTAARARSSATDGGDGLRLPGGRSRALRRGRVRRRRPGALASRRSRTQPKSNFAVTGLYVYDGSVADMPTQVRPSARGELEITELNNIYLRRRQAAGRAHGPRVRLARHRHPCAPARRRQLRPHHRGAAELKIGCPEEIAYRARAGSTGDSCGRLAKPLLKNEYGQYLQNLAQQVFEGLTP